MLGGPEISIIELHKDKAIGGCFHSNNEHFVIWSGVVTVIVFDPDGKEDRCTLNAGQSGMFPKGYAHAMIAHVDSLVSEWGITAEEKQLDQKHPILRKMVDDVNAGIQS